MIDFGTVRPGTLLYIPFHTFDSNDPSASVTLTGLATTDIEIYKDGGTTQRASDNGYALLDTDGIDFDAITGIHGFSVDLADNSTAGFYAAGSQYWIVISSVTVDAATINFIAATFRIGYEDAVINTTIATLSSQTSFTLSSGPAEDDALNGMAVIIHDVASAVQLGHAVILDYTGSTKTVTLAAGTTFTAAATDNISIMRPMPLQPTTMGRTLDVSTGGEAGVDWANVGSPTTTVGLSGTTVKTATDVETDTADIQSRIPSALVGGRIDANVGAISSDATAADNAEAFFDGTGYAGTNNVIPTVSSVTAIATGGITAGSIAADAIGASELAADAVTEIQSGLATAAALDAVDNFLDTEIAAIKAVTDQFAFGTPNRVNAQVYGMEANTVTSEAMAGAAFEADVFATDAITAAAIAADAITEIQTDLATVGNQNTIINLLTGLAPVSGTIGATGNDTTHLHLSGLAYADDAINSMTLVIKDVSTGLFYSRWIEDWADTGDLATVATLPFTPQASTDLYWILPNRADVTGGSGLDAAGVRAAIGLASANLDTQLTTIDDFLDTEVAAIKAKTDNLPSDPADASDIAALLSTITGYIDTEVASILAAVDTEVAAIKAKTDNLPASPANEATLTTIAGYIDTEVASILAAVDTEVAAIKAKTDNLPTDPADASDIAASFASIASTLSTLSAYVDTEVAAIKAKTDSLTFTVAGQVDANALAIDGSTTAADRLQRSAESIAFATVGSGSTTTSIVTSAIDPSASVADQFKGRIVIFDKATTTAALRGQATDITASTSGGILTVTALTTAPSSGDTFTIV